MTSLTKFVLALNAFSLLACNKPEKVSSDANGVATQDDANELSLSSGQSGTTTLCTSSLSPWVFSGNDTPYPVLQKNSYFFMGNGYTSEASYLMCKSGALSKTATLTFTYKIEVVSSRPDFVAMETNNAPNSGTIGIIIFQDVVNDHGRFWYNKRVNLDPGTYTITAPISDLANWSSVYGKSASSVTNDFYRILANAKQVGVTFGGGGHYGHGVRVFGGTAKFTILSMTVGQQAAPTPTPTPKATATPTAKPTATTTPTATPTAGVYQGIFTAQGGVNYTNGTDYCYYRNWPTFVCMTGRTDTNGLPDRPDWLQTLKGGGECMPEPRCQNL